MCFALVNQIKEILFRNVPKVMLEIHTFEHISDDAAFVLFSDQQVFNFRYITDTEEISEDFAVLDFAFLDFQV